SSTGGIAAFLVARSTRTRSRSIQARAFLDALACLLAWPHSYWLLGRRGRRGSALVAAAPQPPLLDKLLSAVERCVEPLLALLAQPGQDVVGGLAAGLGGLRPAPAPAQPGHHGPRLPAGHVGRRSAAAAA